MTGDYVEYDYTTGEERLSGGHLEQHAIIVEPVRPWGMAVLDWLGPYTLLITSVVSVAMWGVVAACAWLGMSAAGYFEVPQ